MNNETGNKYDPHIGEKANSTIAKNITALCNENAKNTNGLRDYLGVTSQAISQFKNGIAKPKLDTLVKIAEYFDCSLDYIVGLSRVRNRDASLRAAWEFTGLTADNLMTLGGLKVWKETKSDCLLDIVNLFLSDEDVLSFFHQIEMLVDVRRTAERFDKAQQKFREETAFYTASVVVREVMDRVATAFAEEGYKTRFQIHEETGGGTDDGES